MHTEYNYIFINDYKTFTTIQCDSFSMLCPAFYTWITISLNILIFHANGSNIQLFFSKQPFFMLVRYWWDGFFENVDTYIQICNSWVTKLLILRIIIVHDNKF